MDPLTGAAIISGGASVISGYLNQQSNDRANFLNRRDQREFAQKGVRWRVADARAAGIHPALALGANLNGAQPTQVGSNPGEGIERASRAYLDAALQNAVTQSDKTQAEIGLIDAQKDNVVENTNQIREKALFTQAGQHLWKKYRDNQNVVGGGTIWILDEEAAQSMQGTLPMFMTIKANGERIYGNSINELKQKLDSWNPPKNRTRGQRKHGGK